MDCAGIVTLRSKEEKRLQKGHLWVFSNEISEIEGEPENGEIVAVRDFTRTKIIGYGFCSLNSLVSIRMLSRTPFPSLEELFRARIHSANRKRLNVGFRHSYRMVFGESDFLPGLVIDRFGDVFVIESFTAGMDKHIKIIIDILVSDFAPCAVIEKSLSVWRKMENLDQQQRLLFGSIGPTTVISSAMSYNISILEGQKTGFFLDQSENRLIVEQCGSGKQVLDCFCNDGGFALHAAKGGAATVLGVDASCSAVERARVNSVLNKLNNVEFHEYDVFKFLEEAVSAEKHYDLIILDPPAFVKSKKTVAAGLAGYERLNRLAMRVLTDDGMLLSCTCSQHISETDFLVMLHRASVKEKRSLQLASITGASKDHPVYLPMPETRYLTCVLAFVQR
jgi:23S rRNA (cytosine1962-C5)-methyltransferase